MQKKWIIRIIAVIIIGFIVSRSIRIQSLETYRKNQVKDNFDAETFAMDLWENRLPLAADNAVDAGDFILGLKSDPEAMMTKHGRFLGIADAGAVLLRGQGRIVSISEDGVLLSLSPGNTSDILIETAFIFGNAVRDASGLVDVNDFPNSTDFNNISGILNQKIRDELLPPFLEQARPGQPLVFTGAAEISRTNPELDPLTIIPIKLKIQD